MNGPIVQHAGVYTYKLSQRYRGKLSGLRSPDLGRSASPLVGRAAKD
jgi:hypothetical protein